MKKTTVVTTARRKLVVRAEAIATLAPTELAAVVGGELASRPPSCFTSNPTTTSRPTR